MKKNWKKVLVGTLCLVGFLLLLVKENQFEKVSLISTEGQSYEKAVVTKITKDNLAEDGNRYGTQEVRVQVKSGAYAGEELDAVNPSGSLFGMENCEVGSRVIVIVSSTDDNAVVTVYSKDRTMAIYLFVLFFCLVICIIGGKKGVKAIASLAFTGVCIVYLMFPLMYRGISPIGITIVVVILSTLLTLWLLGGVSKKTVSAVVGTVSGVVVAVAAAVVFGKAAGITGYNVSDIETLNYVAQNTHKNRTASVFGNHYSRTWGNHGCWHVNCIHDSGTARTQSAAGDKRVVCVGNPCGARYDGNHGKYTDFCLCRWFVVYARCQLCIQSEL